MSLGIRISIHGVWNLPMVDMLGWGERRVLIFSCVNIIVYIHSQRGLFCVFDGHAGGEV